MLDVSSRCSQELFAGTSWYDICRRNLDIERPTYTNLNRLLGQVIACDRHLAVAPRACRASDTYQASNDSIPSAPIVMVSMVLAMLSHADLNGEPLFDALWMPSLLMSVVRVVSQLWLVARQGSVQALTSHYIWDCGWTFASPRWCCYGEERLVGRLFVLFYGGEARSFGRCFVLLVGEARSFGRCFVLLGWVGFE